MERKEFSLADFVLPEREPIDAPVMYPDLIGRFLTEHLPTPYRGYGMVWQYHFNAMYETRCAHPMGCDGWVLRGQNYYHRQRDQMTIHAKCAEKLFHLSKGEK